MVAGTPMGGGMPRHLDLPDPSGDSLDATDVAVVESVERFSEIRLEDGTTLRTKPAIIQVFRAHDRWDRDGSPVYVVRSQNLVCVLDAPDELTKGIH